MKEYQGHRSYSAWNQALYINNEYQIYHACMSEISRVRHNLQYMDPLETETPERKAAISKIAARRLFNQIFKGEKTPDGIPYNRLGVKLAIADLVEG